MPTRHRHIHYAAMLAAVLSLALILTACQSDDDSAIVPTEPESNAANQRPAPTAIPVPIPTTAPTGTPIPELAITNTKDGGNVEILRSEDLDVFGHYDEVRVAEDGTRHLIPLNSLEWGGVARDGIPSLDSPSYVGPDRWSQMVYDPEGLVIGVEVDGKYRAYPLQILIWHEIVNETFEGKHLLVTY